MQQSRVRPLPEQPDPPAVPDLVSLLEAGLSLWIVSDDAPFPKSGVLIMTESSVPEVLKTTARILSNALPFAVLLLLLSQ